MTDQTPDSQVHDDGPAPDAADTTPPAPRALPRGAVVDGFEIVRTLADTHVGMVYLAIDLTRDTEVVLKEYMPQRLARREGSQMRPQMAAEAALLQRGLQSFIGEGEMLAEIEDAALVRVIRVVAANATAYHVMPHLGGTPLLQLREEMTAPPDELSLRTVLDGLLGALEALHRRQPMHGAVSPHNILLLADDRPLLLGPGLAHAEIASGLVESLMAAVEPTFEAPEQLEPHPWRPTGPWTDLYSLAETMRFCLSGELPLPAGSAVDHRHREAIEAQIRRLYGDASTKHYSRALLDTLAAALDPNPASRPQSVAEFRKMLGHPPLPDAFGIDLDVGLPLAAGGRVDPAFDQGVGVAPGSAAAASASIADPSLIASAPAAASEFAPTPETPPWVPRAASAPTTTSHPSSTTAAPSSATPPASPSLARPAGVAAPRPATTPPQRADAAPPRRVGLWAGSAIAALALAAAYAWWYRTPHTPPAAPPPPNAGAVVVETTPPATPQTPSASMSTTAAPAAEPAALPTPAPPAAATPEPAATPAPSTTSTPTATPPSATADSRADAATPAPPPEPPQRAQPAPRTAAPERPKPSAASPRDACAGRTQFATYRCMQTQCAQAAWTRHPQCERLRATDSID